MLIQQSPALALVIASTDKEDGSKELLIDKLIGKAYKDNDILEELITV
jgi:hypothetical protein